MAKHGAGRAWNGAEAPRWAEYEERILKAMYVGGASYDDIAGALKRSKSAIASKVSNYRALWGLPVRRSGRKAGSKRRS